MRHTRLIALASALILTAVWGQAPRLAAQAPAELKVGDKAPDFSLVGTDGKTHKLGDLKGKAVVVAWFPKAFTSGCTTQCKALKESGEAIRAYDVAYFAASVDDVETNKKFAQSLELDFPILSDPGKQTARAYGVVTDERPVAFRWTFYIKPDGTIGKIDKQINTSSAGTDTAKYLAELGVKKRLS